jgi:lysozyme
MDILREKIKESEGLRLNLYLDTTENWSIGYGRNLRTNGISEAEANIMLEADLYHASGQYLRLPWSKVKTLNENRRRVIVEMIFNMGLSGVLKFKKMWAAIAKSDFDRAAIEMLDSKWSKQVGNRAVRMADEMREG